MENQTQNLDPKLKEAYDRIMRTGAPQPVVSNTPQPSANTAKPQAQVVTAKNRKGLSPILLAIVIILFFIIYTVIWTMVFKLKIPFSPF